MNDPPPPATVAIGMLLAYLFSWYCVLFMVAQALPFIVETWMQQGILVAVQRYAKQWITLAPLHFIFQSKIIGVYVANELRTGGAQYIATGRGLPTQRVPFLTLYQNFAQNVFYDGARLLAATLLVFVMGFNGDTASGEASTSNPFWAQLMLWLTITSWLFAPFIFNPYQFANKYLLDDVSSLTTFFAANGGAKWKTWYETTQLRQGKGLRVTIIDILYWLFVVTVWYTSVGAKMHTYNTLFPSDIVGQVTPQLPPIILSTLFAAVAAALEPKYGKVRSNDAEAKPTFNMAWVAPTCAVLSLAETWFSVAFLMNIKWWKTCVAALILKYFFLSMALAIAESMVGLGWCSARYTSSFARLWLYGHRMSMDMAVTTLIFCPLLPAFAFDYLRENVCQIKGKSLHNLLVFRSPGQAMVRREAEEAHTESQLQSEADAEDLSMSMMNSTQIADLLRSDVSQAQKKPQ